MCQLAIINKKEKILKIIAERIKELRLEKGLSVLQMANELHISHTSIIRWENGSRVPNIENLIILAKYYKVTIDYICGLED